MAQNTNLNIAPYFDDFDSSKGFLKVLFKPGYPVQARELTTLQSLLQNQIDSFGQGVYKEGAQVIPGGITLNKDVACVIIQNNYLNLDVELYRTQLDNLVLKGSTSGVRARVLFSISSTTSIRNNITFYINYLQKADDNVTTTFTDGETLTCESDITYSTTTIAAGTPLAQLLNANANSKGSTANVGAGVYYVRGYFAPVTEQTLILDQYGIDPTYKVGLKVEEKIITADEDESLYDNAIGSTNFSAPGADRFKINLTLVKKNLADPNSADFIELLRTNVGEIEKKVERSDLGFINEILATRTKEESGDYYVKKFEVDARENLDDGFNNGVYEAGSTTGDGNPPTEENIAIQLSSGAAYISGFRTERLSTTYKDVDKPRTFVGENNKYVATDIGNYVFMTNLHRAPSIYEVINLRDTITGTPGTIPGSSKIVGQTRVLNFAYESGTVNTQSTVYRTYFADTKFFTGIELQSAKVWNVGDFVVGRTSGATGFIAATTSSSTTGNLTDVVGTFIQNEQLDFNVANGENFGQLVNNSNAVKSYNFTDVKAFSFTDGVNPDAGTADVVLDVKVALPGSGPIISSQSGSGTSQTATVTATLSNFNVQLKVGDIVEFTNNNIAHKCKVTAVTDAFNFNVQKIEAGAGNMNNSAITGQIVRSRAEIKEAQKNKLLTYLGYDAIKNTNKNNTQNPSGSFRKYFAGGTASGGVLAFNAGSGLVFTNSNNNDTFLLIDNTTGDLIQAPQTDVASGQIVTVSSLSGSNNYSLIATVSASDRTAKGKTTERMKILKLDKSVANLTSNGLTREYQAGDGYGYRVDDARISLGCGDVFKIKAIYEANGTAASADSTIPNVMFANLVGTLTTDEVVTGDASGARARIVAIAGNNDKMYFIPVEDDKFTDGETITAPNATFKLTAGTIIPGGKNITDSFDLDDGQRDQFYDYSSIVRKSGYAAPTHQVLVIFDRFLTTTGINPYTVDSYPTADYKIIPNYDGQELRDVIDFRPIVPEKLANTGSVGSPFTFGSNKQFFDFGTRSFTGNETGIPGPGETTIVSLEHYLARVDKVFMNKDNVIQVVKGAPSTNPVEPEDIEDAMLLATINYNPYVFDVDEDVSIRETNFKRYTFRDIQVLEDRIKTLEFYTQLSLLEGETASMEIRDTSGLSRFKNGFVVDNFASLATSDTLHTDYRVSLDFEEGQMRPAHYTTQVPLTFSTASTNVQQTGDLVTLPYTDTVLLDQAYASGVENVNPFNVFTYVGDIELYPEKDNWVDTKTINPVKGPVVEGNFLTTVREYNADQNGFSPVQWNSWKTTWTGTSTTTKVGGWRRRTKRSRVRTITTTKTTTRKQTRTGIRYRVTPVIEQKSLGNKVVSVEHIQFMRSRNIEFDCQKLKPRTKFFAFFDGIALPKKLITPKIMGVTKDTSADPKTNNIPFQVGETVYCRKDGSAGFSAQKGFRFKGRIAAPNEGFEINPLDGSDIQNTNDYTANLGFVNIDTKSLADQAKGTYYGSPKINDYLIGETSGAIAKVTNKDMITDKKGKLRGSFFIDSPKGANNLKFKTGSKLFRLTDDATDSKVIGVSDSSAEVEFTASGILQTMQDQIISVRNAKVTSEDMFDSRTVTSSSSTSKNEVRFCDPLAQTFLIEDQSLEGGVFLTKVDIFFFTKDEEIPVSLDIRTVVNGNPTQIIVPLSKVTKEPADVFTSTDASTPTSFVFKSPVYLPFRQEHAIVLTSDSNQYKVFISILGQDAIDAAHAGEKISEQPYIGVLFKSQNASTWTPSQYEDLMFKIFRADFTLPSTASNSKLVLENAQLGESNGGFLNLAPNAMQMTEGQDTIRVFHGNHGMQSPLNYVQIGGVTSEVPDTTLTSAIASQATNFTVSSAALFHTNMSGSAVSNSNPGFVKILGDAEDGSEDEIIAYNNITGNTITIASNGRNHNGSAGSATGKSFVSGAVVQCFNLNGIPLTSINTTHTAPGGIITIHSPHSYNLKITGKTANTSMMGGGVFMTASQNIPWDVLTPQILNQTQPKTSIIPRVLGTSGTSCGPDSDGGTSGLETSFVKDTTYLDVVIGEENYFPQTKIIANQLNEINRMNNVKSFTMELDLESEVSHLSPVVDLSAVSIITTANVVNNIEPSADIGSECAANYITKVARMDKSATGLKVMLSANTFTQSTIRLMYKLVPVGFVGNLDDLPFQFFNTTGIPDSGIITPQNDLFTFTDYEYTLDDTEDFDGFQIKVSLLAYDQPYIPRVKDLRAIALA